MNKSTKPLWPSISFCVIGILFFFISILFYSTWKEGRNEDKGDSPMMVMATVSPSALLDLSLFL
uniref:Uncharacterized protein n=1 Tax=Nelumbo nucifera TaxID=4432 RepID=A0A822XH18_NELNU|nr:TPA_asm: hypothetical protein HUJ06_019792 [Nelumbo nucifera]